MHDNKKSLMKTREWISEQVRQLGEIQPWWHDIELPFGIRTIGRDGRDLELNHNNVKWEKLKSFLKIDGKTVIDLGCNEGFYCCEARRGGASRVVGIDVNKDRIEKARFVRDVLDLTDVEFIQNSAYELTPDEFGGKFDVGFVLGLLHRVPDAYAMILKATEMANALVFEWSALTTDEPIMKFWGGGVKEHDTDNTGYWRISRQCVREILLRSDFSLYADIESVKHRAIMVAARDSGREIYKGEWKLLETDAPRKKCLRRRVLKRTRRLLLGG